MTDLRNDEVDDLLSRAVSEFTGSIEVDMPDIGSLVQRNQQRQRRRMLTMSTIVVALGLGALGIATRTTQQPVADGYLMVPAATTQAVEWFCSGRLGTGADGRTFYSNCEPARTDESTDWACTGRLGVDDVGRVRHSNCEAVGLVGPLPQPETPGNDFPFGEVEGSAYNVEFGDIPADVARVFCTSVSEIERVNEWDDADDRFEAGASMLIPEFEPVEPCAAATHTVQVGDFPLRLVEQYCTTLQHLQIFNADNEGYATFIPGSLIVIPRSTDRSC